MIPMFKTKSIGGSLVYSTFQRLNIGKQVPEIPWKLMNLVKRCWVVVLLRIKTVKKPFSSLLTYVKCIVQQRPVSSNTQAYQTTYRIKQCSNRDEMADKWNAKQRHVRQRQKNCSDPSNCKVWVIDGAGGWNKAVGGWCLYFQVQLIKIEYNKTIRVLEFIQTGFKTPSFIRIIDLESK